MPTSRHDERPTRRVNPSGKVRWVARYTNRAGDRVSAGTYDTKREAQDAINAAYGAPDATETVRGYASGWMDRHPRRESTATAYRSRLSVSLEVPVDGKPFGDLRMTEVRRREVNDLIAWLLAQGRARNTTASTMQTFAAMWENAIDDDVVDGNPFRGVRVRADDPRVKTAKRAIRVYSWQQMHAVAAHAPAPYGPAMCRVLSDCGLRVSEMLALERTAVFAGACGDVACRAGAAAHLHVDGKTGPRVAPLPGPLATMLAELPPRLDTRLLFPTESGAVMVRQAFYDKVWYPARKGVLEDARPHEFRHSWVSLMRASGVDWSDAADAAGHSVQTASATYTHSLGRSFEMMGKVVGDA